MTHATRTLQSHDLSGEGIRSGSHVYFFDTTRTWRASPDEGSAQCRGHPREHKHERTIHTTHASIHSNTANMKGWLWRPNDIRGSCGLKASWHCLTDEVKLRKTLPKKLVPTGDRTRARCVTSTHATTCSTVVDCANMHSQNFRDPREDNISWCFTEDSFQHSQVFLGSILRLRRGLSLTRIYNGSWDVFPIQSVRKKQKFGLSGYSGTDYKNE